jgi:hypothetical protein
MSASHCPAGQEDHDIGNPIAERNNPD